MVWKKLLTHFRVSSRRAKNSHKQRRLRMERMERREVLASDIGSIAGIAFIDRAGDGLSVDDPPVLVDINGDLVAPGTPGAQGIQVQLFEDTDGNNQQDVTDLLVGTDITDADGNYRFDNLALGTYFVQQQSVPQLDTPDPVMVVVTNDAGIQTVLIDDYSLTTQNVTANAGLTESDSAAASDAIGGERDIQVTNTAGTGQVSVLVDSGTDTLSVGSLGDGVGTVLLQYDGPDGVVTLDPTGLGGVSLAGGAAGVGAETNSGLVILSRAENAGDTLQITIYSDAANSSTATITLPQDNAAFIESFVQFDSFAVASGAGADFNNVGAIEATIGLSANNDAFVSIVEARRPDVLDVELANILPVTLGGQIFLDNSPTGQNDGDRDGDEPGILGVTLDLYQLPGPDDVVDPDNDVALTSTSSGANGTYLFSGLAPGNYAVVVPANQFQPGAILFGMANSNGNDPPTDPDNNIDGDDNGTTLGSGAVISGTITLESNSEPIDDDDTNNNTNTTVDFGFFPQIDLSISKTLNTAGSNVVPGGTAIFDFAINNLGPLDATNVTVEDIVPTGLSFDNLQNASGSFTTTLDGTTLEVLIGDLAANSTANFQLVFTISSTQALDLTNTASVSGAEVDIDDSNNSDSEVVDLPSSDLSITKTDSTDPVIAGNQMTYVLTVTNDGPEPAESVVITDQLPAAVTFVSGDLDGDASLVTSNGSGQITGTVGTLAAGASSTMTIVVDVAANAVGPLTNQASVVASPNNDIDPSNNSTTEDTQVDRLVDVAVTKTLVGNPVAGGTFTYQITVSNTGPSQARGVSVTDTLDANLNLVAGSFDPDTSGAALTENGQDLTFTIGLLEPGASQSFSFDVLLASSAQGNLSNTALIATSDPDSDSSNNADASTAAIQQEVNLVLTKTVDLSTAVPGQDQVVYTFEVSHGAGSLSDATGVMVTDMIPAGLIGTVIDAPNADSTDFTSGVVTVGYNSVPVGQTRTFTLTANVDEAAAGTVTNSGSVDSAGTELDPSDNSDSATITLTPDFDVVVTKSVNISAPRPNENVTYTVNLTNAGPSTAPNVVLSDTIPTGLTFVSGTLEGQAATSDGTNVSFPSISLDPGTSLEASLVFTVDANATGLITNTASVPDLSGEGERDVTNNSDNVQIDVVPQVDLQVTKTVSATEAIPGSELVYSITVTNAGPSTATNVEVIDTLPEGVSFVDGTGPTGEPLSAVQGVITVDGGDLANNASFTFTINAVVDAGTGGNQVNTVTVSSDVEESDPASNTTTAAVSVDPSTSTFSGLVFLDRNNNGVQDINEPGIADVTLSITGSDFLGNPIAFTVLTDANGVYTFNNLARGVYEVTETQPDGFREGSTILGTGATATVSDNQFSNIAMGEAVNAINFNFAERPLPLSKRSFLASS